MRVVISYPLPFDAWPTFEPFVRRFLKTLKQYDPGHDFEVAAVSNWGEATEFEHRRFRGTKTRFVPYYGNGCDAGSWFAAANGINVHGQPDAFVICLTTRCYFHRDGWLRRLTFEHDKHGPGLYTTSCSHEGGTLHPCLRAFGVDSKFLQTYPDDYVSRDQGTEFEAKGKFADHVREKGGKIKLVTWSGCYDEPDWFKVTNRFRDGDQSNVLIYDKHTDAYRDADEFDKGRLAAMANPPTP